MIVGDVGCLHAYIRRLLHIGAERSAIKPVANKNKKSKNLSIFAFRTPSGARTLDPNIKSVVLYQLS